MYTIILEFISYFLILRFFDRFTKGIIKSYHFSNIMVEYKNEQEN